MDDRREDDEVGRFFIEDSNCSEDEEGFYLSHSGKKHYGQPGREGSPPLLLAFSINPGRAEQDGSPASSSDLQEEDQHIEEWMILGGEQEGDSSIQLNLSYWSSCSSEDDSEDEGLNMTSVEDAWALSERDKHWNQPSLARYFACGRSLTCHICNRTGHLAKSCHVKKCPNCILCGVLGHIQRDCPGRHCPSCGLPFHGLRPCEKPPVWNQHCQRCGVTGHLSDACPDTWRQYHLTIQSRCPLKPRTVQYKKHPVYCYNCAARGHYGYECTKRRFVSGMFPTLPYVCHYDTMEDIHQRLSGMQKRAKELVSTGSLLMLEQNSSEPTGESGEENQTVRGRSRRNKEACGRFGRRKTWPERRRERQEVKRLRREAQARREGGLLWRPRNHSDGDTCTVHQHRSPLHGHGQSTQPLKKRRQDEAGGRSNKKRRESERWKKRGGMKRGYLYPCGDLDIDNTNLVSPKQRVRHRRR
ncbi:zinc finger CCHC domain-containing protein 7-like [Aulostomus maculatus]